MKHESSGRRSRKRRKGKRRKGRNKQTVYDSNGPDVRIRGTAHQVSDKYDAMAKDALSTNDYVLAQSYLQHAEHYRRIINEWDNTIKDEARARREARKSSPSQTSQKSQQASSNQKSKQTSQNERSRKKELEDA